MSSEAKGVSERWQELTSHITLHSIPAKAYFAHIFPLHPALIFFSEAFSILLNKSPVSFNVPEVDVCCLPSLLSIRFPLLFYHEKLIRFMVLMHILQCSLDGEKITRDRYRGYVKCTLWEGNNKWSSSSCSVKVIVHLCYFGLLNFFPSNHTTMKISKRIHPQMHMHHIQYSEKRKRANIKP